MKLALNAERAHLRSVYVSIQSSKSLSVRSFVRMAQKSFCALVYSTHSSHSFTYLERIPTSTYHSPRSSYALTTFDKLNNPTATCSTYIDVRTVLHTTTPILSSPSLPIQFLFAFIKETYIHTYYICRLLLHFGLDEKSKKNGGDGRQARPFGSIAALPHVWIDGRMESYLCSTYLRTRRWHERIPKRRIDRDSTYAKRLNLWRWTH